MLFLSGLRFGPVVDPLPLQLLTDYVTGNVGSAEELAGRSSRIVRVIVAGDTVATDPAAFLKDKALSAKEQHDLATPARDADLCLAQLASALPVDLMPGQSDPANLTMPQQPMHPCIFPLAARYSTLNFVTNPFACTLGAAQAGAGASASSSSSSSSSSAAAAAAAAGGASIDAGVTFLGHSGQPVADALKYGRLESPLKIMCETLRWRHIAPTAPDTLSCYPFSDMDPFILKSAPHVYFAGNQPSFETAMVEGTRVIAIPSFAATRQAVLLSLDTLEARPLTFGVDVDD